MNLCIEREEDLYKEFELTSDSLKLNNIKFDDGKVSIDKVKLKSKRKSHDVIAPHHSVILC